MSNILICNNCKSFWYKTVSRCVECGSTTLSKTHKGNHVHLAWVETDPDNFQFGRQIGQGIYEFKEFDHFALFPNEVESLDEAKGMAGYWTQEIIDLSQISDELKESVASSYYGSLDWLKEQCGYSWEWILDECIFEHEYMSY